MTAVAEALFEPRSWLGAAGGEPTLDDVIAGVWEGLTARSEMPCPVCRASMAPEYGAGSLPIGGRCRDCDATLR